MLCKGAFAPDKPLCGSVASRVQAFNIVTHLCGLPGAPSSYAAQQQSATPTSPDFLTPPMQAAVDALWAAQRDALPAMLNAVAGAGIVVPWSSSDSQRGMAGYVGLRNPGMTCYQNSVLQQLFMIPRLRVDVLTATPMAEAVLQGRHGPQLLELREQFQRMFVALSVAQQRSYDPHAFVRACADQPRGFFPLDRWAGGVCWAQRCVSAVASDLPCASRSPVQSQNDANEFFSLLLDRLGTAFGPSAGGSGELTTDGKPKDLFEVRLDSSVCVGWWMRLLTPCWTSPCLAVSWCINCLGVAVAVPTCPPAPSRSLV